MTNKEIKFELAKAALLAHFLRADQSLQELYEWIIEEPEEEIIPEEHVTVDYESKPIQDVYNEMQIMEEEEKLEKKRAGYRNVQKKGHAVRFLNAARLADIETVGQLIAYGKADFIKVRNMGRNCADYVSMALKNLYGIEKW